MSFYLNNIILFYDSFYFKSLVHKNAKVGKKLRLVPFCTIGRNVKIGHDCILHSHINIQGDSVIGDNTEIFPFVSIGSTPQDLKYKGENKN